MADRRRQRRLGDQRRARRHGLRRRRPHARDARRSTTPATPAPGSRARSSSTRPPRPTSRRSPRRAGATRPTRSCSTARTPLSAWPASAGSSSSRARPRAASTSGHAGVETATVTSDGTHTLEHPRPRHRRQLLRLAHRDDPDRPRAADRQHDLSERAGRATATSSRSPGTDDRVRRRRGRVEARRRPTVKTDPSGDDHRRGRPHARDARAATTPATGATGSRTRSRSVLGDGHRPRRPTTRPSRRSWRTAAYTVDRGRGRRQRRHGRRLRRVALIDDQEIQNGPPGDTFTVSEDGIHEHRDARVGTRPATTPTGAPDAEDRPDAARRHDGRSPSGWVNTPHDHADRDRRDVRRGPIEYDDRPATPTHRHHRRRHRQLHARRPTATTRSATASTTSPASAPSWKTVQYKVDTVDPVNTSAAAPTAWQTPSLSLDLTGTDAGVRRRPRRVARRRRHRPDRLDRGRRRPRARRRFETRVVDKAGNASAWRPETIKVDHTKPDNTTAAADHAVAQDRLHDDRHRHRRDLRRARRSSARSTAARPRPRRQRDDHRRGRAQAGDPRHRRRRQRLRLAHRHDRHRPHRADAGRRLRRPPAGATRRPTCSVAATAGSPACAGVTADGGRRRRRRGLRRAAPRAPPRSTSAPSTAPATRSTATADVKVDTTPPAPAVKCVPDAGRASTLHRDRQRTRLSGVAGLAWSVDGSRRRPRSPTAARFTVDQGPVVVYATDNAGNGAASAPVALADRTAPASTPTADARALEQRGRAAAQGRRVRRAPGRPAGALVAADRDHGRPAPARDRQGHVPVRLQDQDRQEDQDGHQDPDDQEATRRGSASRVAAPRARPRSR